MFSSHPLNPNRASADGLCRKVNTLFRFMQNKSSSDTDRNTYLTLPIPPFLTRGCTHLLRIPPFFTNFVLMIIRPALYMIPVGISDAPLCDVIPEGNIGIIRGISHFIVENIRTARRFLKRCDRNIDIDAITFYELNGHTDELNIASFLEPLRNGHPLGMMSEAGCPGVADPGAQVAEIAQREGLRVIPLAGPSSILMSLMASGFNGQGFAFNGYLPIENDKRTKTLRELENRAYRFSQTQIFIETPYRNARFFEFLTDTLRPETLLCVAVQITDPEEEAIVTKSVAQWRSNPARLEKVPAIFLISKP